MESNDYFSVESCSWDLTMNMATNVFGKLFLRSTSSSSSTMPEAIDHVGIIVYNRLLEYGHSGVLKSSIPRNGEDPMPQYPGCKLRKREFLGKTSKKRHEFVEWLVNMKYERFRWPKISGRFDARISSSPTTARLSEVCVPARSATLSFCRCH
ncbi:hypothetical protein Fcan01_14251 [Folsomia candida]|uniref:Uncharacterized protein n=1 Tax=Folsomia candida TaxID=158441 RepID=A0A226E0A7_FOLCA|nr:hypothetical protein Fcan01_14251 [Folsomia candida]